MMEIEWAKTGVQLINALVWPVCTVGLIVFALCKFRKPLAGC